MAAYGLHHSPVRLKLARFRCRGHNNRAFDACGANTGARQPASEVVVSRLQFDRNNARDSDRISKSP